MDNADAEGNDRMRMRMVGVVHGSENRSDGSTSTSSSEQEEEDKGLGYTSSINGGRWQNGQGGFQNLMNHGSRRVEFDSNQFCSTQSYSFNSIQVKVNYSFQNHTQDESISTLPKRKQLPRFFQMRLVLQTMFPHVVSTEAKHSVLTLEVQNLDVSCMKNQRMDGRVGR